MNLRQIEIFHAIFRTGSLTAAAAQLGVSQPAISKALQHMEQQLGYPMFERRHCQLAPTPHARELIDSAERIMRRLWATQRFSDALSVRDGTLRLAATPGLCVDLMARTISRFHAYAPAVHLDIQSMTTTALVPALHARDVDFGLILGSSYGGGQMAHAALSSIAIICLVPLEHPLERHDRLSVTDIAPYSYITIPPDRMIGRAIREAFDAMQATYAPAMTVDSFDLGRQLCERGLGLALVDSHTAARADSKRCVRVPLLPRLACPITLMHLKAQPLSLPGRRFLDAFEATLRDDLGDSAWPLADALPLCSSEATT